MPTTDIEVCPEDVHNAGSSVQADAPKGDQHAGLRRVAGPIPWLLFLICVVEVCSSDTPRGLQPVLMPRLVW